MNRPVIFISAVSRELRTARDLVAKTLMSFGYEPKWQDIEPTETGDLRAVLRKWVDDSAGVIQLVGHCYGFAAKEPDADFGQVSYTQYEALYARQQGKPVWYILLGDAHEKDGCACEPVTLHQLQDAYREKVKGYGDLYHRSNNLDQTKLIVLQLRDELAKLRRNWLAWAAIITALLVLISGCVFWVMHGQAKQDTKLDNGAEQNAKVLEKQDQLLAAIRDFPGVLGKQSPAQNPQDEAARIATAYAELEKKLHLQPGTLEKELPKFAKQLLARADTKRLERASAFFATGNFAEAEAAALAAKDHALAAAGKPVQDAIAALMLAGDAASEQIHYREALDHFRAAAALTDEKRDPREWARVQYRIAYVLDVDGKAREAESIYRSVVEAYSRVLGAEHPDTLSSRNDLVGALQLQGKNAEAEQEIRAVLDIRERVLGTEHADTLENRVNLATELRFQGKNAEAEQEYRAVLAIRERVLGREHPDTLSSRNDLAIALQVQGKNAEAEPEIRAVLIIQERVLGAEHPGVFRSCFNLALCLEAQKKLPEALAFMQRAETGRTKVLGPEHPDSKYAKAARTHIEDRIKYRWIELPSVVLLGSFILVYLGFRYTRCRRDL